jgi:4-amino-4-deoxy-L-arabinose transferase-like glycosyltransferase
VGRRTRRWQLVFATAVVALAVVPLALAALSHSTSRQGEAKPSAPCWRRILADWSQNGLEQTYPIVCYHAALAHMPEDVRVYTTAPIDIQRALLAALRGKNLTAR